MRLKWGLGFKNRVSSRHSLPLSYPPLTAESCPEHGPFQAFTETSKPGGIADGEEQHPARTGESSDASLLETRREPWAQPAFPTVPDHSLTLKAKANQSFWFYPDQNGARKGNKRETIRNSKEGEDCATSAREQHYGLQSHSRS